jgi:putative transposase
MGGFCYHVLNRGNGRARVFHDADDNHDFVRLLQKACARLPMRLVGFCLMPNHFHLVVWPRGDHDLGPWMQWLMTAHVHGYRKRYGGSGHVWQGRFKAFPIEQDDHLWTVLRYAERNPLRAGLVVRAEDWPWSSLPVWLKQPLMPWLDPGPAPRHPAWKEYVATPQTEAELEALRRCVAKAAPFGSSAVGPKNSRGPRPRIEPQRFRPTSQTDGGRRRKWIVCRKRTLNVPNPLPTRNGEN